MEILKKITTLVLSIILFGGSQLHTVDAIEISNETKINISKEINL
jgi:hypothetical protein